MLVGSFLELYTTMIGWYMYEALWNILTGTGIILVPFIIKLISILLEASGDDDIKTSSLISKIEVSIYSMLFVMVFAASPFIILYPENTTHESIECVDDGSSNLKKEISSITADADTNTTASNATAKYAASIGGSTVRMPIWWYLWFSLSNALSQAMKMELPCIPNLRLVTQGLASTRVDDPKLQREMMQFQEDCWKPAAGRYLNNIKDPAYSVPANLGSSPSDSAIREDISWIGSRLFLEQGGYYDLYRSQTPQDHYFFRQSTDSNSSTKEHTNDTWIPICKEWWSTLYSDYDLEGGGLRERLLTHIKSDPEFSSWGKWFTYWGNSALGGMSDRSFNDYLLRTTLQNQDALTSNLFTSESDEGIFKGIVGGLLNVGANVGVGLSTARNAVEANVYRSAAPIIKALIMMLFVMFLPLLLAVSLFDLSKLIILSVMIFSVVFWGYLFELAEYIDNYFLAHIVSGYSDSASNGNGMTNMTSRFLFSGSERMTEEDNLTYNIFKWITRMLYVAIPLIFSSLMSFVGVQGVAITRELTNSNGPGSAAKAGGGGVGAATTAIKLGKK